MRAALIFSSTSHSINVQKVYPIPCPPVTSVWCPVFHSNRIIVSNKISLFSQIFKIVLSKAFDLKCTIPEISNVGEPLLLYQSC